MDKTFKNNIVLHKTYAEIIVAYLWYDFKVKISLDDVEKVDKIKWCFLGGKPKSRYKYFYGTLKNKRYLLHRYIIDCPKNLVVDHINHNTLDNRRSNLRVCSLSENLCNNRRNKTKLINIHKIGNSWRFQKMVNGKKYSFCSKNLEEVIEYRNKIFV